MSRLRHVIVCGGVHLGYKSKPLADNSAAPSIAPMRQQNTEQQRVQTEQQLAVQQQQARQHVSASNAAGSG